MDYSKASNEQLKAILEHDGECPSPLLYGAIEEAVRRDLYKHYITRILNHRFKAIRYAEIVTKLTFEEIKLLAYEEMFETLKFYKPGKYGFIGFWSNFIHTALNQEARKHRAKMRTAEIVYLDEKEIQIIADHNTERKAINRVLLEQLFSNLPKEEQFIIVQYNNDFTFAEIGKEIQKSREYVRKKYYWTIDKLKRIGA